MQSDKTCPIVEQYLAYLVTIKGRSKNTVFEYRLDVLQFFRFIFTGDDSMTNEEIIQKAHEEFALRGISQKTGESYLCALRLFVLSQGMSP